MAFSFQEVMNVKLLMHDGRTLIAAGHLSDSGDLNTGRMFSIRTSAKT